MALEMLGADLLESSSLGKDLGVLVGNELSVSQQCHGNKRASGILGCIGKSSASRPFGSQAASGQTGLEIKVVPGLALCAPNFTVLFAQYCLQHIPGESPIINLPDSG
ncbi:hypothetical protein TURU_096412 [Turdus rufiventris]|nr:hypothetical protein TURU_096412 [Turdus rufiventris]